MAMVLSGQSAARAPPAAPAINPAIAARRERSLMPSPTCSSLAALDDRLTLGVARCHSFRSPPQHDQHDGAGNAEACKGDRDRAEDQAEHLAQHAMLDRQHRLGLAAAL